MTWADAALAAFLAGARTSRDIERALGITRGHAKVLTHNMRRKGLIEAQGRLRGGDPGRRATVFEVATCQPMKGNADVGRS